MSEQRYTLNEAQNVLRERECASLGHDFDVVVRFGGEPAHVLCGRCGRAWGIRGGETAHATAHEQPASG